MSIPAGIREYVTDDTYKLYAIDDAHLGQTNIGEMQMWGLRQLFSRSGGDVGDHLLVKFKLTENKVVVLIRDEPFDPLL